MRLDTNLGAWFMLQPVEWPMQSRGVVEAGHVARLAPGRNAVVELLLKVLKNCPGTAPPPTSAVPPLPGVVGFCVDGKDPTCTSWSGGSDTTASCNQHTSTMSNGPSWGTPEWSARQEFELIKRVAAGDEQTRQLWLQKQRVTATVQQLATTAAAAAAARAAGLEGEGGEGGDGESQAPEHLQDPPPTPPPLLPPSPPPPKFSVWKYIRRLGVKA